MVLLLEISKLLFLGVYYSVGIVAGFLEAVDRLYEFWGQFIFQN